MRRKITAKSKAFNNRVDHMLDNRVESSIRSVPEKDRLFEMYDEEIKIIMHGEPIVDSRPRFKKDGMGTYNPHKAYLMRVFGKLYEQDEMLKRTVIDTPCGIKIRNYVLPEAKIKKLIGVDIINEKHISIKQKDNDNIEKVHWDVLQDIKYNVLLDDRNITHNLTTQFYSVNPRIEIDIQYPSKDMLKKYNKYFYPYKERIMNTAEYKQFKITPKYIFNILKTPDNKFPSVFFNNMSENNITVFRIKSTLSLYSARQIELLAKYCKCRISTRIMNEANLIDIISKEAYPITNKRRRILK